MRTSSSEEEYDSLFNADQRNMEAEDISVGVLDDVFHNRHKMDEAEIVRNWYNKHWISYQNYLELTKLPF